MSRIGALDDRGELRIAHAGHLAGRADGARADAHLDDVGASKKKLFSHVARDDVARHQHDVGIGFANLLHEGDERLRVAVGDVDADIADRAGSGSHHLAELLPVVLADAERIEGVGLVLKLLEKVDIFLGRVVLVKSGGHFVPAEGGRHLEGAGRVHVGGDDGDAVVGLGRVQELEFTGDVHFAAARERRALRADEDVLEVEFDGILKMHG